MCIFRDRNVPEHLFVWVFVLFSVAMGPDPSAFACSCAWEGPFLTVVKKSPLVVRGKILRHHAGPSPAMDVLVLETLCGGLLDSGMQVQMGDGMHCRPLMSDFPIGTEWILALNGPGAKPGKGLALSHCGEYWLATKNGRVTGSIDGKPGDRKSMTLAELRRRLRYPAFRQKLHGRIQHGQRFQQGFGPGFVFVLEPVSNGWEIRVRETGREENLARLTPPLHFVPNPREIEGWQFMEDPSGCSSRPYNAEAGPENPRKFIFSPEVGRAIQGPDAQTSVTVEEIETVRRFGRGTFTIEDFALGPGKNGCPELLRMGFTVEIEGGF